MDICSHKLAKIEQNTVELPPSIEIKESSVITGEAGAFSKILIPKDTRFGPYKGTVINAGQKDYIDYRFAWEVFEKNSDVLKYTISAMDSQTSNWMRHVNCARFFEEQNIISIQEGYSIYYVAIKDIQPGEELLTWFDPKLLKRTKRRLSKMERKPVGYTIELVPWSDEKKFVPEIIETKRARKKKVLSDMISLDENPLALTRTLQRLSKLPSTPKQLAQSSLKRTETLEHKNITLETPETISIVNSNIFPTAKEKRIFKSQSVVEGAQATKHQMNCNFNVRPNTKTTYQNPCEEKDKLKNNNPFCPDTATLMAEKRNSVVCSHDTENTFNVKKKRLRKNISLLRKSPIKLERHKCIHSSDGEIVYEDVTSVKPVVITQNEDGSTAVEDYDETYILSDVGLLPECGDECPCFDRQQSVRPLCSMKERPDIFVIHFTLLPEHKSSSPDNKIIYKCDICGNAYNHAFSLKRHYLSVHVNHRYLSKDDIISCQIETFHTGTELYNKAPQLEMQTPLVQSKKSRLSISAINLSNFKQSNTTASEDFMDKLTTSVKLSNAYLEHEIPACKDEYKKSIGIESMVIDTAKKIFSVPSLKSLAQMSVDKSKAQHVSLGRSRKLSAICEESKQCAGFIHLECDESLDFDLLCPESEISKNCPAENKSALQSANLCYEGASINREIDSEVDHFHDLVQDVRQKFEVAKFKAIDIKMHEKDTAFSVVESSKQRANFDSVQLTVDSESSAEISDKMSETNFCMPEECCTDESLSAVNNLVSIDSHIENTTSTSTLLNISSSKTLASNHNLCVGEIIETPKKCIDEVCEADFLAVFGNDIVKSAAEESFRCSQLSDPEMVHCSSSVVIDNQVKNIQAKIMNSSTTSVTKRKSLGHKMSDVFKKEGENRIKVETNTFSDRSDLGIKNFVPSIRDKQTLQGEAYKETHTFSEDTKGKLSRFSMETPFKFASNEITVVSNGQDNLPDAVTLKCSQTISDELIVVNSSAKVNSCDPLLSANQSSSTNDIGKSIPHVSPNSSTYEEKIERSQNGTCVPENSVCDTKTFPISTFQSTTAPIITSTSSVATQNQLQQLIFVTNIVIPVVSSCHTKIQNSVCMLSSAATQGTSTTTNQTVTANHTSGVPLVVLSQVPCDLSVQNATNAFLQSTTAIKSSSLLPSNNISPIMATISGNSTLENLTSYDGLPSTTIATTLISSPTYCCPIKSEHNTTKLVKPGSVFNHNSSFAVTTVCDPNLLVSEPTKSETDSKTDTSSFSSPKKSLANVCNQPDDLYRCHMCVLLFKTMHELKLHIRNDPHRFKGSIKQYACLQCSMRFSNKNNLIRHNLMNHPENENYKFRCFTCGKGFMSETYLKMHARFHSGKNFPCKYGCADIYFPNAASLVKHLRTQHAGLNLKEYLLNSKAEKLNRKKLNCVLDDEHNHNLEIEVKTLEISKTVVSSSDAYSLEQPGMGFQAKRGHPKSSKNTSSFKSGLPKEEGNAIVTQELKLSPDEKKSLPHYLCNICFQRFNSHLKLLQHRTLRHGANQSVQEYLYQMSKEKVDEEMSEADIKHEFSPPPSPKTFFENVNRKGFENIMHYIDGNSESLKFWQKHLIEKDYITKSEPMCTSLSKKKLEWTMFNFPPCFEYKEDCTMFYDSTTKLNTVLSSDLTGSGKETGALNLCDVSILKSTTEINTSCGTFEHKRGDKGFFKDDSNVLNSGNEILFSTEKCTSCTDDSAENMPLLSKLRHKLVIRNKQKINSELSSSGNALEFDSCDALNNRENVTEVKYNLYGSQSEDIKDIQKMSGYSSLESALSNLYGNKVDVVKQEFSRELILKPIHCETFPETRVNQQRLKDLSVKDMFQALKSQHMQALNIAISGVHQYECVCSFSDSGLIFSKVFSSVPLIDALDLQIMDKQLSSEMFQNMQCSNCKNTSSLLRIRDKTFSPESLATIPQDKHSHEHFDYSPENSFNNSDTSRHDHRRYSIWTGQVHQNFDNGSKEEIFCQPVTEALRKQGIIQKQAKYKSEKSARDKEICAKHKITKKICFAEELGLMTREEFELSYHAQKQEEFVIKVPEVWGNYENIWFGKRGNITVVCSICHRHFSCWDLCLRHQLKKHPHIEPAFLEMEKDNYVEDMYYYYPMPYGILAQTCLIPDNMPVPEVYVCTRCGFPFKNLNRLHAHIIVCHPDQNEGIFMQNDNLKKSSYVRKKLLPIMDRRVYQNMEHHKTKASGRPFKSFSYTHASIDVKNSKSHPSHEKKISPTVLDDKALTPLHSRANYFPPFSFYSGKTRKNYELLYNPQNHTRRREMYKVLDQHQCHGCNLKFKSLPMLERHVKKCSGRDKLQNQKPLLSGIMSDDAALRKQHTCRYCSKRFTYIKGVELHYKRICAVRKVKEEENILTEEDFAHEAELKKIIEHIKWSKSLNKDSSDIIQGHVRVEEDGTLTRIGKQRGWPQGLKKKVRKKGFNWTSLKRHRPEDDKVSISSTSSSTQSSPILPIDPKKFVTDIKAFKKGNEVSYATEQKKITRNTIQEVTNQGYNIVERQISAGKSPSRKRARVESQISLTGISSKNVYIDSFSTQATTDKHCHSRRDKIKKSNFDFVDTTDNRQNKKLAGFVKNDRENMNESNLHSMTSPKNSVVPVPVALSITCVDTCIKPPARKRDRPKRFDPSDMESSYKKKKKCNIGYISHQRRADSPLVDFNESKQIKCNITCQDTCQKMWKTKKSVKDINNKCDSNMLRRKSPRHLLDSVASSYAESNKCASSIKEEAMESKETCDAEFSKLLSKMQKLKDVAKSERCKVQYGRKSSYHTIGKTFNTNESNHNYFNKKVHVSVKSGKQSSLTSSSELMKHLTKDEKVLIRKTSAKKSASNRKKTALFSCVSEDSTATAENKLTPVKHVNITTLNTSGKPSDNSSVPTTKAPVSLTNDVSLISGLKILAKTSLDKITQKLDCNDSNDCLVKLDLATSPKTSSSLIKTSVAINMLASDRLNAKGISSKHTSPVFKQPTSVRVVTLSPNGNSLLTCDGAVQNSHSAVLMTKSMDTTHVSLPTQKILSLPQGSIQFLAKSLPHSQPKKLLTSIHEQGVKSLNTETYKTLSKESIHAQSPVGEVQELSSDIVCEYEGMEMDDAFVNTEKYESFNKKHNKCNGELAIQADITKGQEENCHVAVKNFRDPIILSSAQKSQPSGYTGNVHKLSIARVGTHYLGGEIALLKNAGHIFKKKMSQTCIDDASIKHIYSVIGSIPQAVTAKQDFSNCQMIGDPVTSKHRQHTMQQITKHVQSVSTPAHKSYSHNTPAKITATNCQSLTNNYETVSAIIVPCSSIKPQSTVPKTTSSSAATRLSFPIKLGSPAKTVTMPGKEIPILIQGNTVQTSNKILKLGSVCVASERPQNSCMPAESSSLSASVTQKSLPSNAGNFSSILSTEVNFHHSSTQQTDTNDTVIHSLLNIENQANVTTQLFACRRPDIFSQEVCKPQSKIQTNLASIYPVSSMEASKTSKRPFVSTSSNTPVTSQILFSLEDGTTAMLDPDSLAQFLSTSPSLSKSDLFSVASVSGVVPDDDNTVVLSMPGTKSNQSIGD